MSRYEFENGTSRTNPRAILNYINATAPYNFVGLPSKILESPLDKILEDQSKSPANAYKEYIDEIEKYSGYIELDMRLLSPLFIRGDEGLAVAPIDINHPIIPGSSIRGMVKNLYKIITCGGLRDKEDYYDRHLYYRCIMAPSTGAAWMRLQHEKYKSIMTHPEIRDGHAVDVPNAKAGFLMKIGSEYWIAPYLRDNEYINSQRIFITEYEDKYGETIGVRNSSKVRWDGTVAYIITGSNGGRLYTKDEYNRLSDSDKQRAGKQQIRCLDLKYIDMAHWKRVSDVVIAEYEGDITRGGVNLLKTDQDGCLNSDDIERLAPDLLQHGVKTLIPCFFIEENGVVTRFGHGQSFRIAYNRSIGDAIPRAIKNNNVDFSDAVFGKKGNEKKENWGSRVFFEDAVIKEPVEMLDSKTVTLSEPKPTSYQLYLKQEIGKPINNWDSPNAKVRGYKMYWHHTANAWNNAPVADPKAASSTTITPIPQNSEFTGKIRFKNLSKEELGALLLVFDMNGASRRIAYRLGQGKALGLGSVLIQAKLVLDKKENYGTLFDEEGWLRSVEETDKSEYIEAFKSYVNTKKMEKEWEKVMHELELALNYRNASGINDWEKRIKSMHNNMTTDDVDKYFIERMPIKTIKEVTQR